MMPIMSSASQMAYVEWTHSGRGDTAVGEKEAGCDLLASGSRAALQNRLRRAQAYATQPARDVQVGAATTPYGSCVPRRLVAAPADRAAHRSGSGASVMGVVFQSMCSLKSQSSVPERWLLA
jgi:hypothetical protein